MMKQTTNLPVSLTCLCLAGLLLILPNWKHVPVLIPIALLPLSSLLLLGAVSVYFWRKEKKPA